MKPRLKRSRLSNLHPQPIGNENDIRMKPGGRLVYATCSLLAEENEDMVAAFLADRGDFRPLHCQDLLKQQGIALETGEYLRLLPHEHGTDGFFAAALQRSA